MLLFGWICIFLLFQGGFAGVLRQFQGSGKEVLHAFQDIGNFQFWIGSSFPVGPNNNMKRLLLIKSCNKHCYWVLGHIDQTLALIISLQYSAIQTLVTVIPAKIGHQYYQEITFIELQFGWYCPGHTRENQWDILPWK